MRHTVTAAILLPLLILSSACPVFADRNDPQKFTIDGVRIEVPYPAAVTEARVPIAYGSHKKTRACSNEETGDRIHGVFDDRGLYHPIVHTPYVPGRFSSMRSLPEEQEWDCGIVSQVGPHDLWFNLDKKYLGTPYLEEEEAKKVDLRLYVYHADTRQAVPVSDGLLLTAGPAKTGHDTS